MARKNSVKTFAENSHYHVYNRGVDKRDIFLNEQDYSVFLHLLKHYLSPAKDISKHPLKDLPHIKLIRPRPLSNLYGKVELLSYCLMPNHFHLLLKQIDKDGMTKLMVKTATTYAMYFNKRYKRSGYLFQGNYKAVIVTRDEYLLHLSRYIHLNPQELTGSNPVNYPYSSYGYYLGKKKSDWIKPDFILKFFEKNKLLPHLKHYPSYREFVEKNGIDVREAIGRFAID